MELTVVRWAGHGVNSGAVGGAKTTYVGQLT